MIAPARVAAYEILSAVSAGRADLPTAIASPARRACADDRDRALAARNRHRRPALARRARPPHRRILEAAASIGSTRDRRDPAPQRLSAAPLTRVPASAVVDDAVDLTRRAGKRSATRLRQRGAARRSRGSARRCRCRRGRPIRPIATAALDYFSITLSHPRWLAARWYDRLGFDATEAWLRFNNAPAPLTLRANRLRVDARGSRASVSPRERCRAAAPRFAPDALHRRRGASAARRRLDDGWFVVQDEASQLVALLAGAHPGRARARRLRVAGRQDDGDCGGDERRAACSSRATSATAASSCCGGRSRRAARPTSASCRPIC